jgi:hypothetical protein
LDWQFTPGKHLEAHAAACLRFALAPIALAELLTGASREGETFLTTSPRQASKIAAAG